MPRDAASSLDSFLSSIGAQQLSTQLSTTNPQATLVHDKIQQEIDVVNDSTLSLLRDNWDTFNDQLEKGQDILVQLAREEEELSHLERQIDASDAVLPRLTAHLESHQSLVTSHSLSNHTVTLLSSLLELHECIATLSDSITSGQLYPLALSNLKRSIQRVESGTQDWIEETDVWRQFVEWQSDEQVRLETSLQNVFEDAFDFSLPTLPSNDSETSSRMVLKKRLQAAPDGPVMRLGEVLAALDEFSQLTGRQSKVEGLLARISKQLLRGFVAPFLESNGTIEWENEEEGARENKAKLRFSYPESTKEGVETVVLERLPEGEGATSDPIAELSQFLTFFTTHSSLFTDPSSRYTALFTATLTPSLQSYVISSHLVPSLPSSTRHLTPYISLLSRSTTFESTLLPSLNLFAFLPSSSSSTTSTEESHILSTWAKSLPQHYARALGERALARVRNQVKSWDWANPDGGEMVEVQVREEEEMEGLLRGLEMGLNEDDDDDEGTKEEKNEEKKKRTELETVPRGAKREMTLEEALAPRPPRRVETPPPPPPREPSPPPPPIRFATPPAVSNTGTGGLRKNKLKLGASKITKVDNPLPPRSPSPPPMFQGDDLAAPSSAPPLTSLSPSLPPISTSTTPSQLDPLASQQHNRSNSLQGSNPSVHGTPILSPRPISIPSAASFTHAVEHHDEERVHEIVERAQRTIAEEGKDIFEPLEEVREGQEVEMLFGEKELQREIEVKTESEEEERGRTEEVVVGALTSEALEKKAIEEEEEEEEKPIIKREDVEEEESSTAATGVSIEVVEPTPEEIKREEMERVKDEDVSFEMETTPQVGDFEPTPQPPLPPAPQFFAPQEEYTPPRFYSQDDYAPPQFDSTETPTFEQNNHEDPYAAEVEEPEEPQEDYAQRYEPEPPVQSYEPTPIQSYAPEPLPQSYEPEPSSFPPPVPALSFETTSPYSPPPPPSQSSVAPPPPRSNFGSAPPGPRSNPKPVAPPNFSAPPRNERSSPSMPAPPPPKSTSSYAPPPPRGPAVARPPFQAPPRSVLSPPPPPAPRQGVLSPPPSIPPVQARVSPSYPRQASVPPPAPLTSPFGAPPSTRSVISPRPPSRNQDGPILNHIQQRFVSPPPSHMNPYSSFPVPTSQPASASSYIPANDPLLADLFGPGGGSSSKPPTASVAAYFTPDPPGRQQRSNSTSSQGSNYRPSSRGSQHQPQQQYGQPPPMMQQQQQYYPQRGGGAQQWGSSQGDEVEELEDRYSSGYGGYGQGNYQEPMRIRGGASALSDSEDESEDEASRVVMRLRGGATLDLGEMDEDEGAKSGDDWGFGDGIEEGGDEDAWGFGDEDEPAAPTPSPPILRNPPPVPKPVSVPPPLASPVKSTFSPPQSPARPPIASRAPASSFQPSHVASASISSVSSQTSTLSRPPSYAFTSSLAPPIKPLKDLEPAEEEEVEEGEDAWGFDEELETESSPEEPEQEAPQPDESERAQEPLQAEVAVASPPSPPPERPATPEPIPPPAQVVHEVVLESSDILPPISIDSSTVPPVDVSVETTLPESTAEPSLTEEVDEWGFHEETAESVPTSPEHAQVDLPSAAIEPREPTYEQEEEGAAPGGPELETVTPEVQPVAGPDQLVEDLADDQVSQAPTETSAVLEAQPSSDDVEAQEPLATEDFATTQSAEGPIVVNEVESEPFPATETREEQGFPVETPSLDDAEEGHFDEESGWGLEEQGTADLDDEQPLPAETPALDVAEEGHSIVEDDGWDIEEPSHDELPSGEPSGDLRAATTPKTESDIEAERTPEALPTATPALDDAEFGLAPSLEKIGTDEQAPRTEEDIIPASTPALEHAEEGQEYEEEDADGWDLEEDKTATQVADPAPGQAELEELPASTHASIASSGFEAHDPVDDRSATFDSVLVPLDEPLGGPDSNTPLESSMSDASLAKELVEDESPPAIEPEETLSTEESALTAPAELLEQQSFPVEPVAAESARSDVIPQSSITDAALFSGPTPTLPRPLSHTEESEPSHIAHDHIEETIIEAAAAPVDDAALLDLEGGQEEDPWGIEAEEEEAVESGLTGQETFLPDQRASEREERDFPLEETLFESSPAVATLEEPYIDQSRRSSEDNGPLSPPHSDTVLVEPMSSSNSSRGTNGERTMSSPEVIEKSEAWDFDQEEGGTDEGAEILEADPPSEEPREDEESAVQHESERPMIHEESTVQHIDERPLVEPIQADNADLPAAIAQPQEHTFSPPAESLPEPTAQPATWSQLESQSLENDSSTHAADKSDAWGFDAKEGGDPEDGAEILEADPSNELEEVSRHSTHVEEAEDQPISHEEPTVQHIDERPVVPAATEEDDDLIATNAQPEEHTFTPPVGSLPAPEAEPSTWSQPDSQTAVVDSTSSPAPIDPSRAGAHDLSRSTSPSPVAAASPPLAGPEDDATADDPWDLDLEDSAAPSLGAPEAEVEHDLEDESTPPAESHKEETGRPSEEEVDLATWNSFEVAEMVEPADPTPVESNPQDASPVEEEENRRSPANETNPAQSPDASQEEEGWGWDESVEQEATPEPETREDQPKSDTAEASSIVGPLVEAAGAVSAIAVGTAAALGLTGTERLPSPESTRAIDASRSKPTSPEPSMQLSDDSVLAPAATSSHGRKASNASAEGWGWDGEEEGEPSQEPSSSRGGEESVVPPLADSTPPPSAPPVRLEKMMVSRRSREVVKIAEEILVEALTVASPSFEHPQFSAASAPLLSTFVSLLSLYRATAAVHNSTLLASVPAIGMQFANDADWIGREVERVWKSRTHGKDLAVSSSQASEVETAIESTRQLGRDTRQKQIAIQRAALMESLDEAGGFLRTSDDSRYATCERALQQVTHTLQRLALVWKPVMTPTALYTTLGGLVNEVLLRVLDEIEDQTDISEEESIRLNRLCKMLHELESLFDGSETSVGREVPIWFKFVFLSELLEASMADILFLFDHGHLVDFSPQEIVRLIRALFSDSPLRNRNVEKILAGHPSVTPAEEEDEWAPSF
ncbi:hypothetical protein JCM16303_005487 [Sporobolomyces ruberrimus]